MKTKNMTTLHLANPVNRSLPIQLLLSFFALMPIAQAVGPDTDGAIAGSNNGEGIGVLVSRTTGIWNTGTGFEALNHLTAGNQNTATGLRALNSDTNGGYNTATGVYSLFSNTSGFFNSATGAYSLANNTTGSNNTANGYAALYFNTADANTATGNAALYHNTTGANNTAVGFQALLSNITGNNNTAIGLQALSSATTSSSTAVGMRALFSNTIGSSNTAMGVEALFTNTTGAANTAIGFGALFATTGTNNIGLGHGAGENLTTGQSNICIGNVGVAGESNTIRIGRSAHTATFIGGIRGVTTGINDAISVVIDSAGQLGTMSSSRRFKHEIKPMDSASEAIHALNPVTFHYKSDATGTPQFGLIAEEVAEVNPDLVVRDAVGEIYTVRYEAVNTMLLNEFLKEHKKVEEQAYKLERQNRRIQEQDATIAQLKKELETLVAHVREQDSKIQRVSDQVGMNQVAVRAVSYDQ
jgi:hypothetical protein